MKNFILLTVILCVSISCYAQESYKQKVSASVEKQIDAIFEQYNKSDSPGVAVAVTKNGKTVFLKGYGSANLEHQIPIDPTKTVFNIGLNIKTGYGLCSIASSRTRKTFDG